MGAPTRSGDWTVCQRTGKRRFPSRHTAIAANRHHHNRLRAYYCNLCHGWHVTAQSIAERDRGS